MTKTNKVTKMSLSQFYQYVDEQQTKQRTRTRRMPTRKPDAGSDQQSTGGRLSDRLKARQQGRSGTSDRYRTQTAARVVLSKPAPPSVSFNNDNFPALVDTPEVRVQGAWAQGIQAILDAKDLPDPSISQKHAVYDTDSVLDSDSDMDMDMDMSKDPLAPVDYSDDDEWDKL